MTSYSERLATFTSWPSKNSAPHPQDMAIAGFEQTLHYSRRDLVKCSYCRVFIHHWKKDEDPLDTYIWESPYCPFALNEQQRQRTCQKKQEEDCRRQKQEEEEKHCQRLNEGLTKAIKDAFKDLTEKVAPSSSKIAPFPCGDSKLSSYAPAETLATTPSQNAATSYPNPYALIENSPPATPAKSSPVTDAPLDSTPKFGLPASAPTETSPQLDTPTSPPPTYRKMSPPPPEYTQKSCLTIQDLYMRYDPSKIRQIRTSMSKNQTSN